jgi:hypothetical protein
MQLGSQGWLACFLFVDGKGPMDGFGKRTN